MACCRAVSRSAPGLPFLVLPNGASPKDADVESFAEFVERMLAEVQTVLVLEHTKRLHMSSAANPVSPTNPASKSSWELMPERQPSTWEQAPPTVAADSSVRNPLSECGTQTRVDWSIPAMPLPRAPVSDDCKPSITVQQDEPATEVPEHIVREHRTSIRKADRIAQRVFGSVASETLRARNEKTALEMCRQVTHPWKRVLVRTKRNPLEMMDAVMGFFIIANIVAIGASCDTKEWKQGWFVVDSCFAVIFLLEMLIKIYFFGITGYLWNPDFLWAWFEVALVILSLVEIAITLLVTDKTVSGSTNFRIIRLIRLVKLLRVCRVPMATELVMMVNGFIGGIRTLISALFLILFPIFVFALAMRETLGEEPAMGTLPTGAASFDTLPKASFTTFRCMVVEDCGDEEGLPIFVLVADYHGWFYSVVYCCTMVLLKFGLYNVIVAIFVEQTVQAAKYNAVYQKRARLNDAIMFQEKALEMAELAYSLKEAVPQETVAGQLSLDEIQALELTKGEFSELCANPEFKDLLTALDVAEEDHLDLFDTLDVDGGGTLDVGEIVFGIAKLRGDARKSDIVAVILLARHLNRSLADFKQETTTVFEKQKRQLLNIQSILQPISNSYAHSGEHRDISMRMPSQTRQSEREGWR